MLVLYEVLYSQDEASYHLQEDYRLHNIDVEREQSIEQHEVPPVIIKLND